MGLDVSHDCWHGPYSSFGRWRFHLAAAIGIPDLQQMRGFAPLGGYPWPSKKDEPLVILLDHSDCDGHIKPKDAKRLADRLEELLPVLDTNDGFGFEYSDRGRAETFIDGLRAAVAENEAVEFH